MKRHLIIKPSSIGDVIMAIPAVEALKREQGGEIWWICGELVAPLVRRYPSIDRIITINEEKLLKGSILDKISELLKLWRVLVGVKFETFAVLQFSRKFQILGLPVRAKKHISLVKGDRTRDLISGRSQTDEFTRILLGLDGPIKHRMKPVPLPGLAPWRASPVRRIGIVPGGAKNLVRDSPLRRWPIQKYVELARLLVERGYEVVLLGAKSDRWTLPAFEGVPVTDKLGSLSLVDSVELIGKLDTLVSHDTGILHMAGLTETPIVAIFGPTAPWEFLPNRERVLCLWGGETLACRPCYDGRSLPSECNDHYCLQAISPELVLEKVEMLLGNTPSSSLPSDGRKMSLDLVAIRESPITSSIEAAIR